MKNQLNYLLISKNLYQAKLLKNLFNSSFGEVFLHLQFAYYSSVLSDFDNNFYDVFNIICNEDFLHEQKLANLIKILGDNPVFNFENYNFEIKYFKSIKQILLQSLELKEKIIIEYKFAVKKIQNNIIKKELNLIICDEEKHRQILRKMIEKI